jgi:class 3 adenylate cyclase
MSTRRRRLSAILHADLSGFVRLMEGAEDRTVGRLKSAQAEVWRPAIETAGGSVVNIVGDSVLAEFASALAAVATAIDIQERMARFNDMLDEDQRLMFRIGLHLGEVIVDEETQAIFGDGVNLAARIQLMAEPGGIAVSRAVRDVTELQVEYAFVDGGEHRAKNVSRSLQIYHVRARGGASTRTTTSVVPQTTLRFRGAHEGKKYAFDVDVEKLMARREGVVIGRDFDQCDVVLSHATVSRRHARLLFAKGVLQIEDLGSTNGTSVDGAAARPGALLPLQAGVTLKIGDIELAVGRD